MPLNRKRHIRRETSYHSECPSLVPSLLDALWPPPVPPTPPSHERSRTNNRKGERKRSRNTYGQHERQRGDAYHTTSDTEEDATPVFRQQDIATPQHSNRAVIQHATLFPASDFFYPDHAISTHTHNSSSEKRLEQIVVSSKLRCGNSKNEKTGITKEMDASVLQDLNGVDKSNLEKIVFKTGIEVDLINGGSTETKGAMMERVREGITKEMDRYFSESIDGAVDPNNKKLAIEKLQSITEDIKSFKDQILDEVRSDQTMGCNPSQQTHQSHVPNVERMQMCSDASSSSLDIISVGTSALPSMPPPLATTVIQALTSSETPSFIADTLQLSNKAESNEGGEIQINEQQMMVCEPCLIVNGNISTETEEQYTNS
eukprot:CAMPEP_0194346164 /NCGR_PEP_ID=MMETSP0171-20130528/105271_1 /TAXON_ID=218684 /ORGANISM="Corethron pennatum, Strain L29A3" /LENGTH=372 /DNA_ID=CAMNT_0039113253 /DNA_START=373 /DNA_END=1488 /DNA_ORIENTATION=-